MADWRRSGNDEMSPGDGSPHDAVRSSGRPSGANFNQIGKTEEMLDHENQSRVEGLATKISRLKGIAVDLESESRESNRYLDDMTDDFGSTTGLLSGSIHRINNMINTGRSNRKIMCYIILGLVGLFLITYYLIIRVTS
ncbi:BET1-like protein isoform X1 [Gigantopelta aegis]|uniref:BET1-like protein isoform X1 n=1 Tax=Gigantopelta aegis TaxID=1735272 RepID=UPI001B88C99B|nr:BET1-like protein isoform X1 [Gigantopelta aegis]